MAVDPRVEVLTELRKQTALLERIVAALPAPQTPHIDLDGKYGNPLVQAKDPRDWSGESMHGRTFSMCPPEYLDLLADRFDYFASREEDATKKRYNELDAARARGWAARLRNGWTPIAPVTTGDPAW